MSGRRISVPKKTIRRYGDWADWVAKSPFRRPRHLGRNALEALSSAEAAAYARERRAFMMGVVFETPHMAETRSHLLSLLRSNPHLNNVPRYGIALDGLGSYGKTTILQQLGREFERNRREEEGVDLDEEVETDAGGIWLPVAYTSLTGDTTERGVLSSIAGFYEIPEPRQRRNNSERMEALVDVMSACGTELLILDDFHHLRVKSAHYAAASNFIKSIASLSSATLFIAGVGLLANGLFDEGGSQQRTPTAGRFSRVEVKPFELDHEAGRHAWQSVIGSFDTNIVLADHRRGDLLKIQEYLWDRTSGVVGSLARIIRLGFDLAIETGVEALPKTLLDEVEADAAAELARKRRHADSRRAKSANPGKPAAAKSKSKRKPPGNDLVRDGLGLP